MTNLKDMSNEEKARRNARAYDNRAEVGRVAARAAKLHQLLTDQGCFIHTHVEADFEDVGDGESGPMIRGHDAYDFYQGESHDIIVQNGLIVDMQLINWDEVRFFEGMES